MAIRTWCWATAAVSRKPHNLLGKGDGTFQPEVAVPTGPSPRFIVAGEFFGDGKPDLAVAGYSANHGTLTLFRNAFGAPPVGATMTVLSSANAALTTVAPGSLASAYGTDLATISPISVASSLPTSYGGTSVSIVDSHGATTAAPLVYVSSSQVNFLVPASAATGKGQVSVTSGDGTDSTANVQFAAVAPGVFELNSGGLAAAIARRYSANGTVTNEPVYTGNSAGAIVVFKLRKSHANSQTSSKRCKRCGGRYPREEVRAARRLSKTKKKS